MKPKIEMAKIECFDSAQSLCYLNSENESIKNFILNLENFPFIIHDGIVFIREKVIQRQYDHAGNKTTDVSVYASYIDVNKWEREYFPDGITVKTCTETTNQGIQKIEYDEEGQEIRRSTYREDNNGNAVLVQVNENSVVKRDKDGHPVRILVKTTMKSTGNKHTPYIDSIIRRKYDKNGNLIREIIYAYTNDYFGEDYYPMELYLWKYDNGRLIEFCHKSKFADYDKIIFKKFQYNEDGTIQLYKMSGDNYSFEEHRCDSATYEYDQYGNWIKKYYITNGCLERIEVRTIKYYDK